MSRSKGDGPDAAQEPIGARLGTSSTRRSPSYSAPDVPIEAASLDALAAWDLDIEDEDGAIEQER